MESHYVLYWNDRWFLYILGTVVTVSQLHVCGGTLGFVINACRWIKKKCTVIHFMPNKSGDLQRITLFGLANHDMLITDFGE
mmetsp:Transcript_25430/g.41961  ORF Transcript_25430/g.41961 Transcript_25430/m.41961 type:complete len:82 (+) Transcript_25430:413-658(+)